MCANCICQLNAAHFFREKCRESDIQLRDRTVESYIQVEYLVEDNGNEPTPANVPQKVLRNLLGANMYSVKRPNRQNPRHNPRTCTACFTHFNNNDELVVHQMNCLESEKHIYLEIHCNECSMPCSSVDNFIQHMIDQHEKPANLVTLACTICNTTFSHEELLQYHTILHEHHSETRLEAGIDGGSPTVTKNDHSKAPRENDWPCPQCGKLYSSNLRLSLHIRVRFKYFYLFFSCTYTQIFLIVATQSRDTP